MNQLYLLYIYYVLFQTYGDLLLLLFRYIYFVVIYLRMIYIIYTYMWKQLLSLYYIYHHVCIKPKVTWLYNWNVQELLFVFVSGYRTAYQSNPLWQYHLIGGQGSVSLMITIHFWAPFASFYLSTDFWIIIIQTSVAELSVCSLVKISILIFQDVTMDEIGETMAKVATICPEKLSIQLAYITSVVLLRYPLVPKIMHLRSPSTSKAGMSLYNN